MTHADRGFAAGQADEEMLDTRDQRLGLDRFEKRRDRADIPAPPVDPGADVWQRGHVYQVPDPTGHTHHPETAQGGDDERERNADSGGKAGQGAGRQEAPQR